MTRKNLWLCIAALFLFLQAAAQQQEPEKVAEPAFAPGEQLSYKLKYGIFTAAEANIKVEDSKLTYEGKPCWHIIADGNTAGTFDVFYKVRNKYESFIDRSSLQPFFYTENRHEGNWHHTDNVTFDHEAGKIKANKGSFDFKGKVFDFVSGYYFCRSVDVSKMKTGDEFDLQYFLDDGIHTLTVTFMGREKVKCMLGTFNCLKFNPTIIPGRIFRKDSKLYLWVTDDENRIPVKAHVEVIVGSLSMELASAKGLKYPLKPLKK